MINDLNKLCFQNYVASLIKVVMKRKNLNCIVNKSSYEKEELKLHQSLLGVKGGGAKPAL